MTSSKVQKRVDDARKRAVEVIVDLMERDGLRWVEAWDSAAFMPCNGVTGQRYRGGNRLHLMAVAMWKGYSDNRWFTFKSAKELGYFPRKGEDAAIVEYWKRFKYMKDENGELTDDAAEAVEEFYSLRLCSYYNVFNAEQLVDGEGNAMPAEPMPAVSLDSGLCDIADNLIDTSRCPVIELPSVEQACYKPSADVIQIPTRRAFRDMGAFVTTLSHEMTHSTMVPLERAEGKGNAFGSEKYAFEELVAELGSTFVCLELGVHRTAELEGDVNFSNHAAYLNSWLSAIKEDPDALFKAASQADSAADYIMGRYNATEEEVAA